MKKFIAKLPFVGKRGPLVAVVKLNGVITSERVAVTAEPAIPPKDAPTAMNGNSRLPCSLRKISAMNPQNTVTTNRANTLTNT